MNGMNWSLVTDETAGVWKKTFGWSSRLQENYRSNWRNLKNTSQIIEEILKDHNMEWVGLETTRIWLIVPKKIVTKDPNNAHYADTKGWSLIHQHIGGFELVGTMKHTHLACCRLLSPLSRGSKPKEGEANILSNLLSRGNTPKGGEIGRLSSPL